MGLFSTKGRDYIEIVQDSLRILTSSTHLVAASQEAISTRSSLHGNG